MTNYKEDTTCDNHSYLQSLKQVYLQSKDVMCSQDCYCNADTKKFTPNDYLNFKISQNGVIRSQDCRYYEKLIKVDFDEIKYKESLQNSEQLNKYKEKLVEVSNLLRIFEETFQCSGFCSQNNYYVFSNINFRNDLQKDCKVELINFLQKNINTVLIIISIAFSILFLILINGILMSCSKERREQGIYGQPKQQINQNQDLEQHNRVVNYQTQGQNQIQNINYLQRVVIQQPPLQNQTFIQSQQAAHTYDPKIQYYGNPGSQQKV